MSSPNRRKFTFRKVAGTAALAAVVAFGVPAGPSAASPNEQTREAAFNLVGFDAEVARAHGYEVVTLPDGSVASVPAKLAAAARAGTYTPTSGVLKPAEGGPTANAYQEKAGECGRSYVSLNSTGSQKANLGRASSWLRLRRGDPRKLDAHHPRMGLLLLRSRGYRVHQLVSFLRMGA